MYNISKYKLYIWNAIYTNTYGLIFLLNIIFTICVSNINIYLSYYTYGDLITKSIINIIYTIKNIHLLLTIPVNYNKTHVNIIADNQSFITANVYTNDIRIYVNHF